jgi:hypothetical protein
MGGWKDGRIEGGRIERWKARWMEERTEESMDEMIDG